MREQNESRLLRNYKYSLCTKDDLKDVTSSQDTITQQLTHPSTDTTIITELMTTEDALDSTFITAYKVNHNELIQLH